MSATLERRALRDSRFIPVGTSEQFLQRVDPRIKTEKIGKKDYHDRYKILDNFGPNMLWYGTDSGLILPTKHEELEIQAADNLYIPYSNIYSGNPYFNHAYEEITELWGIPVAAWEKYALIHFRTGRLHETAPSYVDLPINELDRTLYFYAAIAQGMRELAAQQDGTAVLDQEVSIGINNSAAGVDENDEGLMSINRAHGQNTRRLLGRNHLTLMWLHNDRMKSPWDKGISFDLGAQALDQLGRHDIPNIWKGVQGIPDNMGYLLFFPGFRPEHFATPAFRDFLIQYHLNNHDKVDQIFGELYDKKLHKLIEYVQSRRDTAEGIDMQEFRKFFQFKDFSEGLSSRAEELLGLKRTGELRNPPGWTMLAHFTGDGMILATSFGILNHPLGPIESLGVQLDRKPIDTPSDEMKKILAFDRQVLRNVMAGQVSLAA